MTTALRRNDAGRPPRGRFTASGGAGSGGAGQRLRALSMGVVVAGAVGTIWSAHAFAADPEVTIPSGPFTDGQTITVSGSGFPGPSTDPTGVQILECADQGGLAANLPTDASTCDGTTVNPLPVDTDAAGGFSVPYTVAALSGVHGTSNIVCNATNFCVLWVGLDYNQAFTSGSHAFSKPFEIDAAPSASTGSSTPTTSTPATTSAPASGSGGASASTVIGSATAAASSSSASPAALSGGSLASTGVPSGLPVLMAIGMVLLVAGALGRRLLADWRT